MALGKARPLSRLRRKSRQLNELRRMLVVCEGSKTEPHYLRAYIQRNRISTAFVHIQGGEHGSAPITIFEYALRRYTEDGNFEEVRCVFDRDRHETFDAAIRAIEQLQLRCFQAIVSRPCFEYWLILHFTYTRAPFSGRGDQSPGDEACRELRRYWPEYRKGAKEEFARLIEERLESAMSHAKWARQDRLATNEPNPSTDFDLLISDLNAYKPKLE